MTFSEMARRTKRWTREELQERLEFGDSLEHFIGSVTASNMPDAELEQAFKSLAAAIKRFRYLANKEPEPPVPSDPTEPYVDRSRKAERTIGLYELVEMKDLEGRMHEDGFFRPDPDWIYEPEPRDGTFYHIQEGAVGHVRQVQVAGLRMCSSWKRPIKAGQG